MDGFFVVTGCGRSGTGFMANLLSANGIRCGHEAVFKLDKFDRLEFARHEADSSWFAPLWINELSSCRNVPVLHLTRRPEDVVKSFYRMRIFSESNWPHVFNNDLSLRQILKKISRPNMFRKRVRYVRTMRSVLARYTSIFDQKTEEVRCVRYWIEWNLLVERVAKKHGLSYMRVRIEDIADETVLRDISEHLSIRRLGVKSEIGRNLKASYGSRRLLRELDIESTDYIRLQDLKVKYGYNDAGISS